LCEYGVHGVLKSGRGAALNKIRHSSGAPFIAKSVGAPSCSLAWTPLLAIAGAAFAVEIPFFFSPGIPSGHDVEFHLYSWLEVLSQWKRGIFYPRWAALAHFGYGEPRFIFYPPGSWTLGAIVSAVLPWPLASGVYIWLALLASGTSMFLLARLWLDRREATFAAVLYAVNPYYLVIVYWRSAFAELLAGSLVPLLPLLLLRSEKPDRRMIAGLGVLLAAAWLANEPAAVMIHYSAALLLLGMAWQRRSPRILLVGAAAVALGAGLAAFYLLPAIYEQRWVNIAQVISPGVRFVDNFLFTTTSDSDHNAFNRLVSWMAVTEIGLTFMAAWASRRWRGGNRGLWSLMLLWAAAGALVMVSTSTPLWSALPKLRFVQFPWRWLLCLGVPFSLLTVMGIRRWSLRIAVYLAALCMMSFVWQHYQAPWWDGADDLRELQDNMSSGAGYEGTEEYLPVGADVSAIDKNAGQVAVERPSPEDSGQTEAPVDHDPVDHSLVVHGPVDHGPVDHIQVHEWAPDNKRFTAETAAPENLVVHLFNYPAWRVEVNGHPVRALTREDAGQIMIPVGAGENRVSIKFVRTWDRKAGAWISLLAVVFLLTLLRKSRGGEAG